MSIPAMPVANKANTGAFVLPVRPFMNFWTLLNFPDRKAARNEQRSAEWNRGAYLGRRAGALRRLPFAAQLHDGP